MGVLLLFLAVAMVASPNRVAAFGDNDCLGSVSIFAGTYAPQNWAFCNGQILEISQNCALYSLIGNYYGGDGRITFALPDLRGRMVLGAGQGIGLTPRQIASYGGEETHVLSTAEIFSGTTSQAATGSDVSVPVLGSPQAHNNMQPYLTLNYIICVNGLYPSRQ